MKTKQEKTPLFVVQKHDATHLHYDFRLEVDGVLKSWAIPKGPSLNPGDKRLAMQVEDHPYDYHDFEGVIAQGYGAGTVMVWDEGNYMAVGASTFNESEKLMEEGLKKGHLSFVLNGHKLKGEFTLVHMHGTNKENQWLLVKKDDKYASAKDVTKKGLSVLTNRSLDEIAED